MTRCLLVDDDPDIRLLLSDYLQGFGIQVDTLARGAALTATLARADYDLLLLDLMLPDGDGLALCQQVKRERPALPVIMLTAQGDPMSRVLGLELGADDYVPKPFEPRELVARIKAVLRRGGAVAAPAAAAAPTLRFAGWRFDRIERELQSPNGTVVALSAAEFRLLSAFLDHPGRVLARERLIELTRSGTADIAERAIDLAVSRLRGKLGTHDGRPLIRTVRGEGYVFDGRPEAP